MLRIDRSLAVLLAGFIFFLVAAPLQAAIEGGDDAAAKKKTCTDPSPTMSSGPGPTATDTGAVEPTPTPSDAVPSPSPTTCPSPSPTSTIPPDELGPRPHGLRGLQRMFGNRCNRRANDARTYMPSAWGKKRGGYVYYHRKLLGKVGGDVMTTIRSKGRLKALSYGIWGYACRLKTGGSSWSVHSWGAAIDTNTLRNPFGRRYWDGHGSNGQQYGRFLPRSYMREDFYWGLNFNDPMHFQYVDGY
ncbi:MAG: M15 family metallopeptidase [Actinomycetota bacterium]